MTTAKLKPADQIHFVRSGLTIITESDRSLAGAVTAYRGQTITVTDRILEANSNRYGECWLHLDADAQVERWGQIMFMPGPAPEGMERWTPGTVEQDIARDKAQAIVDSLPLDQRAAASREVTSKFGRKKTSRTIGGARS